MVLWIVMAENQVEVGQSFSAKQDPTFHELDFSLTAW